MASKFTKFGLSVSLAALLIACDSQTPEQKVEALRAAASEHVTAGAYEAAVIEFKNALQVQPDDADLETHAGGFVGARRYGGKGRGTRCKGRGERPVRQGTKWTL